MKKKKIIVLALMSVVSLAVLADVLVVTSCGATTYTLSREKYNELGLNGDGESYDQYLMSINYIKCGEYVLPRTFEVVEL